MNGGTCNVAPVAASVGLHGSGWRNRDQVKLVPFLHDVWKHSLRKRLAKIFRFTKSIVGPQRRRQMPMCRRSLCRERAEVTVGLLVCSVDTAVEMARWHFAVTVSLWQPCLPHFISHRLPAGPQPRRSVSSSLRGVIIQPPNRINIESISNLSTSIYPIQR